MKREDFRKLIENKIVILDGATGTELIKRGMPQGVCPELWALENPQAIIDIQRQYLQAGSDIVYVPSFGGNCCKLNEFGIAGRLAEINRELARISREAVKDRGGYTFGDLAPTGNFVEPVGNVKFEDAVNVYKEQVMALLEGGVDGFVIETMLDIQETRAALLAVKESCDLPVIISMTFEPGGRTLTGNDPLAALITLQALGADAFGCNCSTGPADMVLLMRKLKPYATIPLMAKPNAGLPKLVNGATVFEMNPEAFGAAASELVGAGANIIGGCCGTTPEHIRSLVEQAAKWRPEPPEITAISALSSSAGYSFIGQGKPLTVIGERINPTGKKNLQEELRQGKLRIVEQFAAEQATAGASVLDVNMGLSGINEKQMMVEAIKKLSQSSQRPLCIDSTDSETVEAALRIYPGRALVNSISAEKNRLEKILPIAAKYGAMIIVLPVSDDGIPETAAERSEVVENIFAEAQKYGYKKADIIVDALVMTVSSNQSAAKETLDLIEWASREFCTNTVCGLSNVSFGMPERKWINLAFLCMAVGRGLSAAIANPATDMMMNLIAATDVLSGRDTKARRYIERFGTGQGTTAIKALPGKELPPAEKVFNCVLNGEDQNIADCIDLALKAGKTPKELVDNSLIPAINRVGELYDRKEYFLPQLIMSADAMRKGFEALEPYLAENRAGEEKKAVVVIATVEGDIHDIGKNIVALMLRNYGFDVVDLGKDVAAGKIIAAVKERNAKIVGLSALMTTTMVNMEEVIALAKSEGLTDVKFMIGGAVVDQNYATQIGASYAADAMESVRIAQKLSS
ncbi:MAG: homocysteine S-methyltransferase family protein [Victivallaceae bacterium]